MKRAGMPFGALAPAVILIALIFLIASVIMTDAAAARDRRSQSSGVRKEGSAQKTPARPQETSSKDRKPPETREKRPPSSGTAHKKTPPKEFDRKSPPPRSKEKQPDGVYRDGGNTIERPPRRHDDDPGSDSRRVPPRRRYPEKKGEKKYRWPGDPVTPVIPGGHHDVPPPVPDIHYHDTYIYYDVNIINPISYMYYPICLPGLIDGGPYEIRLPFGPILPWEIGEFYLIRLKNLEKEGLGGSMMITIIQTRDEMGWEEFLYRFEDRITDVRYYGPVGPTAFLVGMTVSDILDLMLDNEIRWAGEFYPDYKIVPGGRNSRFYVLSLEGDTIEFRRELRDAGVYVMKYDHETGEYFVRSSQDIYNRVASLWWVARVSGVSGEPFFQPEDEWVDVGMAP